MQRISVDTNPTPSESRPSVGPRSLASRAVIGAVWTISTSVGSRAIGLVGTLLITRFLDPTVYGEASLAAVVVMTAHIVSNCGLSQYIVSKPNEGRAATFHATFYFLLLGTISISIAVIFRHPIAAFMRTPGVAPYIPGLALAAMAERVSMIQDRILVRDMRFRSVGVQRSIGEVTFAVVSVALAWRGFGGAAIVWASIARSFLRVFTLSFTAPRREWFSPCRINWKRTRDLFAFGLPMSVAALAGFGSRRWDNLIIGRYFGQAEAGIYNLAYNLADIPATQIGETIGDVLVPSFAKMDSAERRKNALLVSMRLLVLIVAPLAVGLGAIAPSLVRTFFDERWRGVASMLIVLSVLSVVRPIGWIGSSYLQVRNKPGEIMLLEISKTLGLLALMVLFTKLHAIMGFLGLPQVSTALGFEVYGSLWACAAVGVAFALNSIGYMWVIKRVDEIPFRTQILPLLPPFLACLPMVAAVIGVRYLLAGVHAPGGIKLAAETLAGAVIFVPSGLLLSPSTSREMIKLLQRALIRRRQRSSEASEPPPSSIEIRGPGGPPAQITLTSGPPKPPVR